MTAAPTLPPGFLTRPIAHRALHDRAAARPENSRAAIRAAVAAGYAIEIDLQSSSDGVAMVFHDDDLDRLTAETGPLRARTCAELAAIHLLDADDGIPTLAQVLDLIAGRVPLLIEIKDQSGQMGPDMGTLPQATAQALQGYGGPVALMSFNPHAVGQMARLAPDVPRGLTTWEWPPEHMPPTTTPDGQALADRRAHLAAIADYDAVGASFISHHWRDLAAPRVAQLQGQGAAVLCWTIRDAQTEALARRVAGNITFEGYPAAFQPT
jgi:glycerophosphoryl diester phosphodiesterase